MISGHSVTSSHVESGAGGPLAGPLTQNIAEADRSQSRDCDVSLLVRRGGLGLGQL